MTVGWRHRTVPSVVSRGSRGTTTWPALGSAAITGTYWTCLVRRHVRADTTNAPRLAVEILSVWHSRSDLSRGSRAFSIRSLPSSRTTVTSLRGPVSSYQMQARKPGCRTGSRDASRRVCQVTARAMPRGSTEEHRLLEAGNEEIPRGIVPARPVRQVQRQRRKRTHDDGFREPGIPYGARQPIQHSDTCSPKLTAVAPRTPSTTPTRNRCTHRRRPSNGPKGPLSSRCRTACCHALTNCHSGK